MKVNVVGQESIFKKKKNMKQEMRTADIESERIVFAKKKDAPTGRGNTNPVP